MYEKTEKKVEVGQRALRSSLQRGTVEEEELVREEEELSVTMAF
jgi:hypothetical protein